MCCNRKLLTACLMRQSRSGLCLPPARLMRVSIAYLEANRPAMSRLLDLFLKVILKQAPSLKATGSEPMVVSFHSPSTRNIHDVAVMFHTFRAPKRLFWFSTAPELMAEGILASLRAQAFLGVQGTASNLERKHAFGTGCQRSTGLGDADCQAWAGFSC